ncbi:MAG: hypothetical protein IPP08_08545 [Chlorobiota bacterium]|nr:MAG: hypothetical protein IPP08_08545 [Chlorobiota bacterium]
MGGIPLKVSLTLRIRYIPEIPLNSSSKVKFLVKFNSSFSANLTDEIKPKENNCTATMELKEGLSAGFPAVGLGVGFEFPRVELAIPGIGKDFTFFAATLDSYLYSLYTFDPACQKSGCKYKVKMDLINPIAEKKSQISKDIWVAPEKVITSGKCN